MLTMFMIASTRLLAEIAKVLAMMTAAAMMIIRMALVMIGDEYGDRDRGETYMVMAQMSIAG